MKKFWINMIDGSPQAPHPHEDKQEALKEAERLANLEGNTGLVVWVMESVAACSVIKTAKWDGDAPAPEKKPRKERKDKGKPKIHGRIDPASGLVWYKGKVVAIPCKTVITDRLSGPKVTTDIDTSSPLAIGTGLGTPEAETEIKPPKLEIHGPDVNQDFTASFGGEIAVGKELRLVVLLLKEMLDGEWPEAMSEKDKIFADGIIAGGKISEKWPGNMTAEVKCWP